MKFPEGFLFGVATAAYQIEGAVSEDGREPSIWDTFCRTPGKVHHGDTGDIACDHYHRVESDLDLLSELGVDAYRFSIAWPRVLPNGSGQVNQKGLDFYKRMLDGLHRRAIAPMVTLYHWDLPQTLEDRGGWRNRDTAQYFADYAAIVAEAFGEEVPFWITLNEPWCSAFVGHLEGRHAPGATDLETAVHAAHHLLLAHGLGVQALREANVNGSVGITLNLSDVTSASDRPEDVNAAARVDGFENRWFLDPIFKASYPDDMVNWYGNKVDLSPLRDSDLEIIASPIDFLGVNFYEYHVVEADEADPVNGAKKLEPAPPVTGSGLSVRPQSLAATLTRVAEEYTRLPLYVTENGAVYNDYVTPEGRVDDPERAEYLERYVYAIRQCAEGGIDVRGYFAWSFLDNFEWAFGYSLRFGLVYVAFSTQTRIMKSSGIWYRDLIASQRHADGRDGSAPEGRHELEKQSTA
jgi:beta-glucosidase